MNEHSLVQRRIEAYRMGRKRRGDIRIFILFALSERPMSGYEIIHYFTELTHEVWIPSQGSVYPTLQYLEEEGLVTSREQGNKKVYSITDLGRDAVEAMPKGSFAQDPEQLEAITRLREANMTARHFMKRIITEGSVGQLSAAADIMSRANDALVGLIDRGEAPASKE